MNLYSVLLLSLQRLTNFFFIMGKGSLFMGMGRGKVGEIVFSRQDGEQVFRARNRKPHNPRTNKQLIQRAIMATVMSAYSAGKEIFDHSFQGYSVGAGNQRRFLSLNANMLRTQLAVDFENATPEEALAKVTAPKIQTIIPNQYVIAEGSMVQNYFGFGVDSAGVPSYYVPEPNEGEKINEYAARVGLNAGDIYTFVFITTSKAADDVLFKALGIASVDYDIIYRGAFGWVRLITKNLSAVETVMTDATLITDLFDVEVGGNAVFDATLPLTGDYNIVYFTDTEAALSLNGHALGLIKSRRDQDLRSNAQLHVARPAEFGLYWNDILTAWRAGTVEIGSSDLILEGGDE